MNTTTQMISATTAPLAPTVSLAARLRESKATLPQELVNKLIDEMFVPELLQVQVRTKMLAVLESARILIKLSPRDSFRHAVRLARLALERDMVPRDPARAARFNAQQKAMAAHADAFNYSDASVILPVLAKAMRELHAAEAKAAALRSRL